MTTYEKIIAIIRQGKTPVIQDKEGDCAACIFEKDGTIFSTNWDCDIKQIYQGTPHLRNKDEIEKNKREIVAIHDRQRNEYKVGDLVDLDIEELEKTDDWEELKDEYGDGKGLEILTVENEISGLCYGVYTKDKSNWYVFGFKYILPHDTTTTGKDKRLEEGIENGYLEDGKIVK